MASGLPNGLGPPVIFPTNTTGRAVGWAAVVAAACAPLSGVGGGMVSAGGMGVAVGGMGVGDGVGAGAQALRRIASNRTKVIVLKAALL